ncbi:MAG: hypothetical protein ACFFD8_07160 [Candidatus Thorarchaeota archaeon]
MRISKVELSKEPRPKIPFPDDNIPKSKLQLLISVIVTGFIAILIIIDQSPMRVDWNFYWILLLLGAGISCSVIGLLLKLSERRHNVEETFLERWAEEIGWPLMILAFTIQFLFPQIRPFLLGAILGGIWLMMFWNQHKKKD